MAGVTKKANINATARAIDFVSSFQSRFEALQEILSTMRLIPKEPGTQLKAKRASIVLENGLVGEAETVPYSQASVTEAPIGELVLHKFRKGVSAEAITEYGYDTACEMTDRAMINAIQAEIMNGFYGFIKGGLLTRVENTFQMALAMAKGIVLNKWKSMQMDVTDVVAFVNVMDVYAYLGAATINNVETQFGFSYVRNFMGYSVVFLLSDNEMPRGKVVATPVDNVVLYHLNPSNMDFARAGLEYTTVGETPLIGSHIDGNYSTVVSDNNVIYGLGLFAEYIDGIAVVDFGGSLGSATATSAAGTAKGTKSQLPLRQLSSLTGLTTSRHRQAQRLLLRLLALLLILLGQSLPPKTVLQTMLRVLQQATRQLCLS